MAVRFSAPRHYPGALGLARRSSGEILPQIEVYLSPVLRALEDARAPGIVGRALARAAAHELEHYRQQRSEHDPAGVLAERFNPKFRKAGSGS